jgi:anti-sigma regulatory factor (Ser/Thr protein kinase)
MVEVRRRLAIPAELDRLVEIRAIVRDIASACEAPADCIDDLVQAVDEAATNIIVHGYRGAPGIIEMTAELVADDIVITLADTAPAFDPTSVPPPDLTVPPAHRRPGGMGVHLMRLATDSRVHRPRPGGGNILTLTRARARRLKEE